jgi:hypothetical protein
MPIRKSPGEKIVEMRFVKVRSTISIKPGGMKSVRY